MKKVFLLLLVLCLFGINTIKAEVLTYKAINTYCCKKANNQWGDWQGPFNSNEIIIADSDNSIFKILDKSYTTQFQFQIIQKEDYKEDSNGWYVYFSAKDSGGDYCHLKYLENNNGVIQFYVIYDSYEAMWNLQATN